MLNIFWYPFLQKLQRNWAFTTNSKFLIPDILANWKYKTLIFQTLIICIYNWKYQRYTTLGCNNIEIRKSKFVAKTQFLCFFLLKTMPQAESNFFIKGLGVWFAIFIESRKSKKLIYTSPALYKEMSLTNIHFSYQ